MGVNACLCMKAFLCNNLNVLFKRKTLPNLRDVECLLCLLESWALASSLTTFKLLWKTATFLALVNAKHCSDLTLLCIDNQHLFLQLHAAIFIPVSGGKTD